MDSTRRGFLRHATAGAAVLGANFFLVDELFGQYVARCEPGQPCPPPPCPWGAACNVSLSVVTDAINTFVVAFNKLKAGTVQATDLSSAFTASQMMFDNFQEAGLYADMQDRINSCSQDSTCANPVPGTAVSYLYDKLIGYGANVTESEVQQYLTFTASQKSDSITQFNTLGMPSIADTTEQSVNNAATTMESTGTYVTKEIVAGSTCYEFGLIIDTLFLLASLFALAALAGCLPCGVIAAAIAAFAQFLQFLTDAYCG